MGQRGIVFTTGLSVKECANVFRTAAEASRGAKAKFSEMAAKMAGNSETVGFYTPTFDSPFASIDGVPDFSIGFNALKFSAGAQGNGTHIHMYVDDQGDTRSVQIVSKHGITGGARSGRFVSKFFEQFQAADRGLRVTEGNI